MEAIATPPPTSTLPVDTTPPVVATPVVTPPSLIGADGKFTPEFAKLYPSLAKYTEPDAAFKGAANLQSMLGNQNRVPVPGPNSTPEEIALFREKTGVPADAKGYELKLPAKLDNKDVPADLMPQASLDKWAERFHKAGIPKAVGNELLSEYLKEAMAAADGINNGMAQAHADAEAGLKKDWGVKYAANLQLAEKAAAAVGITKEVVAADPALANNPNFIRAMVRVGAMMGEDPAAGARGTQPSIQDPNTRIAELRGIMDPTKGYKSSNPQHSAYMQEIQSLLAQKERGAGRG